MRAFLFITFLVLASSAIANVSYPLTCRGGSISSLTLRIYGSGMTLLTTEFAKSNVDKVEELSPGECRWNDRAFSKSEKLSLCHFIKEATVKAVNKGDGTFTITQAKSESAPYIAAALSSNDDSIFNIMVFYNTSNNCLQVTAVLP